MWDFRNFTRDEFACGCGCGFDDIDPLIVSTLQRLRDEVQRPVVVNSGCRCAEHNIKVGGSPATQGKPGTGSRHLYGKAADIRMHVLPEGGVFHPRRRRVEFQEVNIP